MAILNGSNANDVLVGGAGNDELYGLGGDDVLVGGLDADLLDGGGGSDYVSYWDNHGAVAVNLTLGRGAGNAAEGDTYVGIEHAIGSSFGDFLIGDAGANLLDGLDGNDVLIGALGADILDGGAGIDTASYEDNQGGVFVNLSSGQGASNSAQGDRLYRIENLTGSIFADYFIGDAGANRLDGGGGDDILIGGLGGDALVGGSGVDTASYEDNWGGVFVNLATGQGAGNAAQGDSYSGIENLTGSSFADYFIGDGGSNRLDGSAGDDELIGGLGADILVGGAGVDTASYADNWGAVIANLATGVGSGNAAQGDTYSGIENLTGSVFADTLIGDQAANRLDGGAGDDRLDGGAGANMLVGGAGRDTFVFSSSFGSGIDTIVDFRANEDGFELAGTLFTSLASGRVASDWIMVGAAAVAAQHRIIYNPSSGALSYDADGAGGAAAIQFATLLTNGAPASIGGATFTVTGAANRTPSLTSGASGSVAENAPASTIVYQVTATDSDGDALVYSLRGGDAALFNIDAATGAVRLNTPADYEARSTYSISVWANDSSGAGAGRTVTIGVTDVAEGTGATPRIAETTGANDSIATAQPIARSTLAIAQNPNLFDASLPSVRIDGALSANGDVDHYSVYVNAGERLILDIDGSGAGLDSLVRVYDSSGREIGFNDDGDGLDPGSSTILDSFATLRAPTSGTYTIAVSSYEASSSGAYALNLSIGPIATAAEILREDIEALLTGFSWSGSLVTYGFPQSASEYPTGYHNGEINNNFQGFNATQIAATRVMIAQISQVTNLDFGELLSNRGAANLRWAMTDATDVAYAYLPTGGNLGGGSWFNNSSGLFDNPILGTYSWMSILHETGHALGLKHGHELPAISFDRDSIEYSVMTYRTYPGAPTTGYRAETYGYAQGFMMLDIAALQQMYGADFTARSGATVYSWSPNSGQTIIDGAGQGTPGANRIFTTIWDGGGVDTYDLSAYQNAVTIDLRPGEWTTTSAVQLANLGDGRTARGNVANALLFEGDARSLIENAIGGSGGDTIVANQAANSLTGRGGADIFRWTSVGDAAPAALDVVTDFARGIDRIDLSRIDANSNSLADDAFTFIGAAAFTGVAGQLHYEQAGSGVALVGDVNGDGIGDFMILINNQTMLSASDVIA